MIPIILVQYLNMAAVTLIVINHILDTVFLLQLIFIDAHLNHIAQVKN